MFSHHTETSNVLLGQVTRIIEEETGTSAQILFLLTTGSTRKHGELHLKFSKLPFSGPFLATHCLYKS